MLDILAINWNVNPKIISFQTDPIMVKIVAAVIVVLLMTWYVISVMKEEKTSLLSALTKTWSLVGFAALFFIATRLNLTEIAIRWYSLLFVSGFILGWFIFRWFFRREGITEDLLDPLLYWLLGGTLVGARLGHCLFYQPDYYLTSEHFWEILEVWEGGLASHGGTIALFIIMWYFAKNYGRKHDFDFLWILDHLCIAVCFAAMFIRLGNLMNSEIYGNVTTLPWGFVFEGRGETLAKHPTQLYEALSYALLGVVLLLCYKFRVKWLYRGSYIGIFFIILFGMRFIIEFIKEDQVGFEAGMTLNMGQWLSIPFILIGIGMLAYSYMKKVPMEAVHPQKPKAQPTHYAKPISK